MSGPTPRPFYSRIASFDFAAGFSLARACESRPPTMSLNSSAVRGLPANHVSISPAAENLSACAITLCSTLARVEQSVMAQADKFSAAGLMDTWFAGSPRTAELFSDMVGGLLSQARAREKPAAKSKDAIRE